MEGYRNNRTYCKPLSRVLSLFFGITVLFGIGSCNAADDASTELGSSIVSDLAAPMSLSQAMGMSACLKSIKAASPNAAVTSALFVDVSTPCSNVTVSVADTAAFSETTPLIPVVIGQKGVFSLADPDAGNSMTLYASSFLINNGGIMQAGSVSSPVQGKINLIMAGNTSASLAPKANGSSTIVSTSHSKQNARDITVMSGGTLRFYGAKGLSATPDGTDNDPSTQPDFISTTSGTKSWTYLAAPAGPASYNDAENVSTPVPAKNPTTTLTLATKVDWQKGDWISVATTSFTSHQTEIVQVCSNTPVANPETVIAGVPAQVSQISLADGTNCPSLTATPLKHYHFGGLAPTPGFYAEGTSTSVIAGGNAIDVSNQAKSFYDDHSRNFGIDERAEVALLSRNIKLSSVANDDFMGGHLVIMAGSSPSSVNLVGVEIEKFGQPFVGRYPLHLHHLKGAGSQILVQDVSVHHSYNKCFVVHATSGVKLYNNVCVRTVGQGVYLEDGANITGNAFIRNHIAGTMAAKSTYTYPLTGGSTYWDGDYLQSTQTADSWYTINNIADTSLSGANSCSGKGCTNPGPDTYHPGGFWITNINNTFVNNSVAGCQAQGRGYWLLMQGDQPATAYPEFTGNRVHGCYNGLDTAPDSVNNVSNPYPVFDTATYPVSDASDTGVVITSSVPVPSNFPSPFSVTISGTDVVAKGPWPGVMVNDTTAPYSFSFSPATVPQGYTGGGKWTLQTMPIVKAEKSSGADVVITIQNGAPVIANNASVLITGTGTAVDGTSWVVSQSTASGFTLKGSKQLSAQGFPVSSQGWWQLQGDIATMTSSPIVITTTTDAVTANPLKNNDVVTIAGVQGNTNANGNWKITYPVPGLEKATNKFALQGSIANASYTSGGTWKSMRQPPVLLLNNNTVTRSRNRGFWGRSIFLVLHNNRFATNPYGVSLAGGGGPEGNYVGYWDLAHRNVFAGMSRNNVERYPAGCIQEITAATNTSPIVLTVKGEAPVDGSKVTVKGVLGNTSANGQHSVSDITQNADGSVSFNLDGVAGSGRYTSGTGVVRYDLSMTAECTDVALNAAGGWGNYPNPFAGSVMNLQGYSYYDGPARIESNRFVNFRFDPTVIYKNTPEARLLTKTDIKLINTYASQGQLHGTPSPNTYTGYPGDAATGWIQSNAQTVPPTQYIKNSIWDNVDFKHQVYTEAVNLGAFNDGDKTTVILDKDSRLSGLKVVDANGVSDADFVPVSLNSIDYYATDYTVDEPHARGPNNFRQTSLMSPHKYATLNIESVTNPGQGFKVKITRDMPAYGDTEYPFLFLNGRGQKPIYEPFVMDRMGYTIYGMTGVEHQPASQAAASFNPRLLFSYTDPSVKKTGEFFVNRIAIFQPLSSTAGIKVYRIRRQWGQPYLNAWPPGFNPPGPANSSCDSTFFSNQSSKDARWADCLARAKNQAPPEAYKGAPQTYSGGLTLTAASSMTDFEQPYNELMAGTLSVSDFVAQQSFYYDQTSQMLYFYMIEDQPVMQLNTPYGTCAAASSQYKQQVAEIQSVKTFSHKGSVTNALDAACLVSGGTPTPTDLVTCGPNGCAAYLVDLTATTINTPSLPASETIQSATNATPIVVTTPASAPATGTTVVISGVTGNTAANGTWTVTNISSTSFSLNNSVGNGTAAGGQWQVMPTHPIKRADYAGWNQYNFVYGTPSQQANGLPVPAPATGADAPPADGSALEGMTSETDNLINYSFLTIPGQTVSVDENFPYTCLTTAPWSPVNPRGSYPPSGGFPYPLTPLACSGQ